MRCCLQRVSRAEASVEGTVCGRIGRGIVALLGVAADDTEDDARAMVEKILTLRIFDDAEGKMNLSLRDVEGELLVVSQFTLLGDCRKGRRPSYAAAAAAELAQRLYQLFVDEARAAGTTVATGKFRQQMEISLVNDGPVTLLLDTRRVF